MMYRYDEIFEPSSSTSSNSNDLDSSPNLPPSSPTSLPTTHVSSPTLDRTLKRPAAGSTKTERTNVRGIFAGQESVSEEEEEG